MLSPLSEVPLRNNKKRGTYARSKNINIFQNIYLPVNSVNNIVPNIKYVDKFVTLKPEFCDISCNKYTV